MIVSYSLCKLSSDPRQWDLSELRKAPDSHIDDLVLSFSQRILTEAQQRCTRLFQPFCPRDLLSNTIQQFAAKFQMYPEHDGNFTNITMHLQPHREALTGLCFTNHTQREIKKMYYGFANNNVIVNWLLLCIPKTTNLSISTKRGLISEQPLYQQLQAHKKGVYCNGTYNTTNTNVS